MHESSALRASLADADLVSCELLAGLDRALQDPEVGTRVFPEDAAELQRL